MSLIPRRIGALALGLLLVAGCAQDHATAPAGARPAVAPSVATAAPVSHDLLGTVGSTVGGVTSALGLTKVDGLLRGTPLDNDITVSKSIGILGGTLSIPAAGVSVVIPAGALSGTTNITMTARKGSLVAYDFAPQGITFAKPLSLTQKLAGTNATLLNAPALRLGYYSDSSLLGSTTALVSELLGGVLNLVNWSFTAPINHFSGYVVCWSSGDAL